MVVLPGADHKVGHMVAERILKVMLDLKFEEHDFIFSTSVGVTGGVLQTSDTFESYLTLADKLMYRAKNNGRCRVESESFHKDIE